MLVEEQIGGVEQTIDTRADRHHADRSPANTKVRTQRVPLRPGNSVDLGFRSSDRRGSRLYVRTDLARKPVDLVLVQTDCVDQPVGGALAQPKAARAEPKHGKGLDQRDLGGLMKVERATHRGDDGGEAIHLAFACAVLFADVLEVAARDRGGETLRYILQPALGQRYDLVVVRLALDWAREQLDGRPPVHSQHVNE